MISRMNTSFALLKVVTIDNSFLFGVRTGYCGCGSVHHFMVKLEYTEKRRSYTQKQVRSFGLLAANFL